MNFLLTDVAHVLHLVNMMSLFANIVADILYTKYMGIRKKNKREGDLKRLGYLRLHQADTRR